MAEKYTLTLPVDPSEQANPEDREAAIRFMLGLFEDPTAEPPAMAELAHPDFVEWQNARRPEESVVTLRGLRRARSSDLMGLLDYRAQFGGVDEAGVWHGPRLASYDFVEVPRSRAAVVPQSGGQKFNAGFLFQSTFWLPAGGPLNVPEDMPPVNLLLDEQVLAVRDKVAVRRYAAYDENGEPIGPGTDNPDDDQHALVARQVTHFRNTGERLEVATVHQVAALAFQGVRFGEPETHFL